AGNDPSRNGARHHKRGIDLAVDQDLFDLRIGLSENAHRILGGLEVAFGGLLIRGRLIDLSLSAAAGLQQIKGSRERSLLQFEDASGSKQRPFRLKQIRAIDREQDIAGVNFVSDVVECLEDLALILRKYLDEQILVEVDSADGGFQQREISRSHGSDLDRSRLLFRQIDGRFVSRAGAYGFGRSDFLLLPGLS